MKNKTRISVIIPAYNEEKRIRKTLSDYVQYFSEKYNSDFEILVMTDGCTDKTVETVKEFNKKFSRIKCHNYQKRLGKGGAIIEGFRKVKGEIVTYIDADGATKPDELDRLIEELKGCDVVIASRYMDGSNVNINQPFTRLIASRGFNFLVRHLFNIPYRDTQCGAKVLKNHVVKDTVNDLTERQWAFDVDLLWTVTKKGYKIREAPITWKHEEYSKLKLYKVIPQMLFAILRLKFKTRGRLN